VRYTRLAGRLLTPGLAVATAVLLTASGATWRWDRALYDTLLPSVSGDAAPGDPIIVAVDERSLARLGRWPWPRDTHTALLERLTGAGARAVGMDLLFAEPDADPAADRRLAEAIAANGRVVLPVLAESERLGGPLKETLALPGIAGAAAALGHVDLEIDPDGIVRSTFARAGVGAARWPAFAMALARVASGAPGPGPAPRGDAAAHLRWVREGAMLIPFHGGPGTFARVSYSDVLDRRVPDALLRGRVVLVGATAAGLGDALATPFSGRSLPMPGVEIIANVYRAAVDGTALRPMGNAAAALVAALVVLAALAALTLRGRHSPPGRLAVMRQVAVPLAAGVAALAGPLVLSVALLAYAGLWWPPLGAVAGGVLGLCLWAWRRAQGIRGELARSRWQAAATLRSIGDGVVTTGGDGRVIYMNPVAEAFTGRCARAAAGAPVWEVLALVDVESGHPATDRITRAMDAPGPVTLHGTLEQPVDGGDARGVDVTVSRMLDGAGQASGWVFAFRDVTEARALARRVSWQASHDALTALPNRTLLKDRIETGLARARRHEQRLAVMFVDLDRFKSVNDSFGHDFGDRLLVAMASRVREAARAQDTVARIGGDSFVVVVEEVNEPIDVAATARRLRKAVARPVRIDDQDLFLTASVGVSVFPRDATSAEDLLRNADAAMYRAKESGRNGVRYYSEDMNRIVRRRSALERALGRALDAGGDGLHLHFQPIVRLNDGRVTGVEALLRWNSPEHGRVDPEEFISVAEESGLIVPLGEWVLFTACQQASDWQRAGIAPLRLSVNMSPRQIAHQDVPALVRAALDASGLDPDLLELEITESVMLHDIERNVEALTALKALGVHLAVDDFGTGYSSLSFLKRFPVDRVKIDKSFVQDLGSNRENTAIVKAVLAMAQSLGLGVVAEGLETRSQVEFMCERLCDEGQGFFLSPPASSADVEPRLRFPADLRAG